jgi:LysR family cys regulon transcriptional activator
MKLQQLRYVCEIVDSGLNVTRAASEMHTSQPGVSRHLKLLEEELGVQIFVRDQKRISSLTPVGESLYQVARRILRDVDNMRSIAEEYRSGEVGDFTVATSHTHARHSLPPVIQRFAVRYPKVRLRLRLGLVAQACRWVSAGEAHLSISTRPNEPFPDMTFLPYSELRRIVLTPIGHPLHEKADVTLQDISEYPIITYDTEFSARSQIDGAFNQAGLVPNVVLSAQDTDTMKTYVRSGLGIAIVASRVFSEATDPDLRAINAQHLFPSSHVTIGLRRYAYLPAYILDFIQMVAPNLPREQVLNAVDFSVRQSLARELRRTERLAAGAVGDGAPPGEGAGEGAGG